MSIFASRIDRPASFRLLASCRCEMARDTGTCADTFGRRNSISSAVGLNNNTLKDHLYRRVLYRAHDDFYVIFFFCRSLIGDGHVESRESMALVDRVKILFWNFEQIFCYFFRERGEKKRETFPTALWNQYFFRSRDITRFLFTLCQQIFCYMFARSNGYLKSLRNAIKPLPRQLFDVLHHAGISWSVSINFGRNLEYRMYQLRGKRWRALKKKYAALNRTRRHARFNLRYGRIK